MTDDVVPAHGTCLPTAAAVHMRAPKVENLVNEDKVCAESSRKRGRGAPPNYVPADHSPTADFAACLRGTLGIPVLRSAASVARIALLDRARVSRAVRGGTLPTWETVERLLNAVEAYDGRTFDKLDWRNRYERAETAVWRARQRKKIVIGAGAVAAFMILVWLLTGGAARVTLPPQPAHWAPWTVEVPEPDRVAPDLMPALPTSCSSPRTGAREVGELDEVFVCGGLPSRIASALVRKRLFTIRASLAKQRLDASGRVVA